jgi:2-phospho-L-lactate/phosphoenolpyruvate guanylyltransferase
MWAIVPCKNITHAKSRLASVLAPAERSQLAIAMLNDVLKVLANIEMLKAIVVASSDAMAQECAVKFGAHCFTKQCDQGPSCAFSAATKYAHEQGARAVIAVSADLPLLSSSEVACALVALQQNSSVVLAPASSDQGTNLMGMNPVGIIPYTYGDGSFSQHKSAARTVGIEPLVINGIGLGLDIDTPEDLLTFIDTPSDTHAYRYLKDSGITERLLFSHENTLPATASIKGTTLCA